tara:strand:- start:187 stop:591 length:405 start_codon:yes stop_codon:yes gene_type:complete
MVEKKVKKKELKGIKGWLLLPTIGFILSAIFWSGVFVILGFSIIIGNIDSEIVQYVIISAISAGLSIYVLLLLFKKKKEFPKMAIYAMWIGVAMNLLVSLVDGDYSDMASGLGGSILWTLYLQRSVRVKNTFVN